MKKLNSMNINIKIDFDTPNVPLEKIVSELQELLKNNKSKESQVFKDSFNKEYLSIDYNCERFENPNFLDLNKSEHKKFELLSNLKCNDNCYNSPNQVMLKKGSILHYNGSARNGDIFFKVDNQTVILPRSVVLTRYPYDNGVIDLTVLKKV